MAGINDIMGGMHTDLMGPDLFGVDTVTITLADTVYAGITARARRPINEDVNQETGEQIISPMIVRIAESDLPTPLKGQSATNWEQATVKVGADTYAVGTAAAQNNRVKLMCKSRQTSEKSGPKYRSDRG